MVNYVDHDLVFFSTTNCYTLYTFIDSPHLVLVVPFISQMIVCIGFVCICSRCKFTVCLARRIAKAFTDYGSPSRSRIYPLVFTNEYHDVRELAGERDARTGPHPRFVPMEVRGIRVLAVRESRRSGSKRNAAFAWPRSTCCGSWTLILTWMSGTTIGLQLRISRQGHLFSLYLLPAPSQ